MDKESVTFCVSSELSNIPFKIQIDRLLGKKELLKASAKFECPEISRLPSNINECSELFVTAQIYDCKTGRKLTLPVSTRYTPFKNHRKWSQWLVLPIYLSQLNAECKVLLTLWEFNPEGEKEIFYQVDTNIFDDKTRSLKRGSECIKFNIRAPIGSHEIIPNNSQELLDKYILGEIKSDPWLDPTSIEVLRHKALNISIDDKISKIDDVKDTFVLFIRFPLYEVPVVEQRSSLDLPGNISTVESFKPNSSDLTSATVKNNHTYSNNNIFSDNSTTTITNATINNTPTGDITDSNDDSNNDDSNNNNNVDTDDDTNTNSNQDNNININNSTNNTSFNNNQEFVVLSNRRNTVKFYDPEQFNTDPIEEKFRRLERSLSRKGQIDTIIKPDAKRRELLNKIINYPPCTQLTSYEKALIWKYRYYCLSFKKALPKFLQSCSLTDEAEQKEVVNLMNRWTEIDIADAIELLSPSYNSSFVKEYAVRCLRKATDEELELYLLQLVQALKFEGQQQGQEEERKSSATTSHKISQAMVDPLASRYSMSVMTTGDDNNSDLVVAEDPNDFGVVLNSDDADNKPNDRLSHLAHFLIQRNSKNFRLSSQFYWYLVTESTDSFHLQSILTYFLNKLPQDYRDKISIQSEFVNILRGFCIHIKNLRDTTQKKTELLHNLVSSKLRGFLKHKKVVLPLDPSITAVDVVVDKCKVFKSSLSPLKITFKTKPDNNIINQTYSLMFKVGDDLRQDQLVVQIITLMDVLLKSENVDLKLTPYKIVTTGPDEGAIQFIPNDTITDILNKYHGILPFLADHNSNYDKNKHGDQVNAIEHLNPEVMDNFVKSCAGYCVITYILGVGDRHLDNLLIQPDGRFFHADFGYILGRDPKPFPPLMKLPPQIIEAFGGIDSANYDKFRSYCFVAYTILRRNSGLILNLFELMKNSEIPDIKLDPESALNQVKEKFRLDISEEEAILHFQNLINVSVNALLPLVIDHLHNLAQYWRA
ncbi:related to Phosphatidylinositol 3-kinase VPS34 [Saccharomycodes ludwigii]|uniref:Phosphatidylinositol 3-kinase VPS34 n=1 Tax=Saccharomycodes ludwigii TaxID=36035 RepID=A0A376B0W1_9ASCO|nr:related to Phosphatidylinositol 3-kinase VPS34 [Saccharomycodes ludwigii]